MLQAVLYYGPSKIYFVCDGPKDNQEKSLVDKVRNLFDKNKIPNLQTKFFKENKGNKHTETFALNWFFNREKMGIILEDDCLPNDDFFIFCEKNLELYKNNEKVMHISGSSPVDTFGYPYSFYFSKIPYVWGWASWARAWKQNNLKSGDLLNKKLMNSIEVNFGLGRTSNSIKNEAILSAKGLVDAWDFYWWAAILVNDGLTIVPTKNLVTNIGFGDNSTYCHNPNDLGSNKKLENNVKFEPPKDLKYNGNDFDIQNLSYRFSLKRKLNVFIFMLRNPKKLVFLLSRNFSFIFSIYSYHLCKIKKSLL